MKCPQHYLTEIQEVILFYNGLGIPTRKILDSRGEIPYKTIADAMVVIQEMAEYSQKWHNGTSRSISTETSERLAAIQAQLNNLGREIKKVNEKVYAAQVGCEQCKGPHYTKDFPLKEEGKALEEAYYTQFGGPFQGGGCRAAAPGFYQRNNANPSYQERRSLDPLNEDYIELNDLNEPFELRRNQGDDLMPTIEEGEVIEEFRTRDDELDTGIDDYPSYCDYDKKIHIDCAHNLKFSCMIGFEFTHVNFFPLLYVNVMSKKFHNSIMKDKMVYKGNNVIGALMNVPIFVGTFSVVTDFAVLENIDAYRDEGMGDVIFGEPFLREVGIKARRFEGMITIYNGNESVTYQMVRSHPRFKHHTNEQCNKIPPLLKDMSSECYGSVDVVVGENWMLRHKAEMDLVGFTPRRRIGFRMKLVQGAILIYEGSCRLTFLERQEVWNNCRSCKVRVGSNGNLLWEASVLYDEKKGGVRVAREDDRGVTEGREDVREVFQQRRSGVKKKLSRCGRNQLVLMPRVVKSRDEIFSRWGYCDNRGSSRSHLHFFLNRAEENYELKCDFFSGYIDGLAEAVEQGLLKAEEHPKCCQAKGSKDEEKLVHFKMAVRFEVLIGKKRMCSLVLMRFDWWMWFFDGAFRGVGDEEFVVGEGVVVTSLSLEMLTKSYLGGIIVSLIFLEGLEEEALVEFIVELCEEDKDSRKNEKDGLFNLKAIDQSRKA
ncbi:hypothetical protein Tco_1220825 [Tanacetum coccineum]